LKKAFADIHGLDYEQLLSASEYKEKYRVAMINWGEERRNADPGFFCRLTTQNCTKPIWIIPDNRRPSDLNYFLKTYPGKAILVRSYATDEVRSQRGWKWTPQVDDAESECALDSWKDWDMLIDNNGDQKKLEQSLDLLINRIKQMIQKKSAL